MSKYSYPGAELEIFGKALRWKSYFRSHLASYLVGDVLEVGAGIGANTRLFTDAGFEHWVCLEPDRQLYESLATAVPSTTRRELILGDLGALNAGRKFDAIVYLDVLEHIEDDRAEMKRAAGHLKRNGVLIILAPAHQWLYAPFDEAIGHYRRYSKASLAAATPVELKQEKLLYLDSVGLLASLASRLLLKSRMPSDAQIQFWDRCLVPCSRQLDRPLGYRVGKSVLGVWRQP